MLKSNHKTNNNMPIKGYGKLLYINSTLILITYVNKSLELDNITST